MKQNINHNSQHISGGKVFAGILLALAYGFTTAVLLTPMSGKQTRNRLKHFMD